MVFLEVSSKLHVVTCDAFFAVDTSIYAAKEAGTME